VASPYREYHSAKGERIWVGKNAAGNDALTFSRAKPHDLWLHARGIPGSHVVVPLAKGAPASQEVLLDAAHLALYHSDAKGEPRGEVSYTPVKFVHRVKGGAPGQVNYTREKTLLVRIEPERMRRLIETAQATPPAR
jgi:predicted ribosome quality control (RQC) complex YloA/Tae2 family protein